MNLSEALRDYVGRMIADQHKQGMKVLLMDKETTSVISMVYTQSEILQKEVYLVERIDTPNREKMTHLKAICFLRPTESSIHALVEELRAPKYGQYFLYFSNALKRTDLERLAEADEQEVVREVHEFFCDYNCVSANIFTLGDSAFHASGEGAQGRHEWSHGALSRTVQGLLSVCLSLRKRPVVRFQKSSPLCKRLAKEFVGAVHNDSQLFDFRQTEVPPILLVIDRSDDPITPLLNQWTYQAMVHELIGINSNRVDLSGVPGIKPEMKEIVLSAEQDTFFKENSQANFGEIGQAIKDLVERFQKHTQSHQNIDSIQDIKRFIEDYPQFKQMSGTVSKHVTVVSELNRLIEKSGLFEVSELEQDIACQSPDHSVTLQRVQECIANPRYSDLDKVRLAALYALRFERNSSNNIRQIVDHLGSVGVPVDLIAGLTSLLKYAGHDARSSDLFGKGVGGFFKKKMQSLKGIENVYTQHEPLLTETLNELIKQKLRVDNFPFADQTYAGRPQDIIVYVVGGATFEEARACLKIEQTQPGVRVILGSSVILNGNSFLHNVAYTMQKGQPEVFNSARTTVRLAQERSRKDGY